MLLLKRGKTKFVPCLSYFNSSSPANDGLFRRDFKEYSYGFAVSDLNMTEVDVFQVQPEIQENKDTLNYKELFPFPFYL